MDFPINPRNKKEKLMDMVKNNVSKRSWERIKVVLKKNNFNCEKKIRPTIIENPFFLKSEKRKNSEIFL